nr:TetR/AcrR family transcriptional regulator [Tessaracoccus coleopterorum]
MLIGRDGPWLLGLQVTSQDHDRDAEQEARAGRFWIDIGVGGWDSQRRPSEARVNRIIRIDPDRVRRIGAVLAEGSSARWPTRCCGSQKADRDDKAGRGSLPVTLAPSPIPRRGSRYCVPMHSASSTRHAPPPSGSRTRAALIASARRLFMRDGYRVSLTAIAHDAGVGQGALYRHFSTRLDLALAVFAENLAEIEEIAANVRRPEGFPKLWRRLISSVVETTALVEMVFDEDDLPRRISGGRLQRLLAEPLALAQGAGLADPRWTPDDLVTIIHMVYGVVTARPEDPHAAARRALELIDPRLV